MEIDQKKKGERDRQTDRDGERERQTDRETQREKKNEYLSAPLLNKRNALRITFNIQVLCDE